MQFEIKIGSITNAQRGAKLLRSYGIKTTIERLEVISKGDGCGFVLRVNEADSKRAVDILKRNGLRILGVNTP